MINRFLVVPLVAGTLLLPLGCATKTFVREEIQQVGSELAQEKERVSGVALEVEGVNVQVREVRTQATEARSLAGEARSRADQASSSAREAGQSAGQALARAEATDSRLTRLWANRNRRNLVETVIVTFGFDKWELDDRGQTVLLDVVTQLKDNPDLVVDLQGYTDPVGAAPYNLELSRRRVEAVRRFLAEKEIDLPRIHAVGLGSANPVADNSTREGRAQNRRVAIKLFTPVE